MWFKVHEPQRGLGSRPGEVGVRGWLLVMAGVAGVFGSCKLQQAECSAGQDRMGEGVTDTAPD